MTNFFKSKIIFTIITVLSVSLILVGCIERNVNASELLPQSIETMKALDSYISDVKVSFTSESDEGGQVNMNAIITYNKEPFAYSYTQEITSSSKSADNPFDKLVFSLVAKDGVLYKNDPITGLWTDDKDPTLIKAVEDTGDFFQNFNPDQFTDLEVVSVSKNKATIKAQATNSAFIKNLINSFDTSITGDVEMIIDIETKYIESLIYYPEVNGTSGQNNKITILTKDFNSAPEVVVPEEALY